jgi:hypothetical protein
MRSIAERDGNVTLYEQYLALVADEATAEQEALAITDDLRDNVCIDKDGNLTGRPWPAGLGREAAAWAKVAQLRTARYEWIASNA